MWQTRIGCEPATLSRAEPILFVACFDSGELLALNERTGEIIARRWVGHGPFGVLAVGERLYVTLAHDEALLALSADNLSEIQRVATGRQPRGLAMVDNRLYVVHLLDASSRIFDAETMEEVAKVWIGLQGALAESVTLHPNRERAYVPHQRQNVSNMARLFDSTVFPVIGVLDTKELLPIRREALALDSVDTPVSMPAAVALSTDGRLLYSVNSASDDLSVVDLDQGIGVGHVVVGQHPRDLALSPDGKRLYTLNLVSDDISVVDTDTLTVIDTFPLADDPRPEIIQEGERIWLTSRPDEISRDNWMACASCHFDTGFDGQTWLGVTGGPRNTPIVRGIRGTEPLHWSADRENAQAFRATFTGLMGGTGLSEPELDALAAYLDSLEPIASPHRRRDGALSEAAVQGSMIFKSSGCAVCHSPQKFTDRRLHDVGTGEPFRDHPLVDGKIAETMGPAFDTPSLRELWLTAPFLHDGRATALRDVLTTFNTGDQHGRTSGLTATELAVLEAFLLSLPLTPSELSELFGE
ncbi:MAG: beta-propeller fold lactonase family protein [Chloroflexi bacterium]|nr:beta-propeller fold lactonase family protein [Chloroflexota bacterium]